jgi:hypothetical protein
MPRAHKDTDKQKVLRQHGTLNPRPQDVRHPLFRDSDFFDPDDMIQVKYEMLRQVQVDNRPISQAAHEFGFSRPSFYQTNATFERAGLSGLVPLKRGPRSGHKLTPEVMEFVRAKHIGSVAQFRSAGGPRQDGVESPGSPPQHRTTASAGKKTALNSAPTPPLESEAMIASYEGLRRQALTGHSGAGLAVFMRRGMQAWMHACSGPTVLPTKLCARTEAEPVILQGLQMEIVLILTAMLLPGLQEVHT